MTLVVIVTTTLSAAVMAVVLRRTLGARTGWPRTLVVAAVAFLVASPVLNSVAVPAGLLGEDGELLASPVVIASFFVLVFLWLFALAAGLLVVLEAVWPTGSLPDPVTFTRNARSAARRGRRYARLTWVASRSGLRQLMRVGPDAGEFGPRLVRAIEEAGVTFVKMGQMLSARPDLVPPNVAAALSTLQSEAAPEAPGAAERVIEAELGAPVTELFASFETTPFAAASVAQVHRATTHDGTRVVVKVQRPGARDQVAVDSDILVRAARTAQSRYAWARAMDVSTLAQGLAASLAEELDYRVEGSNLRILAAAQAGREAPVLPEVLPHLSGARVLTMTELGGTTLGRADEAIAALGPERRRALARLLLSSLLHGVFVDGVFHADLHPGNILLLDDGGIGLLDLGAVGVLDDETRSLLAALIFAIVSDDNVTATDALLLAFDVPDGTDVAALRRDLGRQCTLLRLRTGPDVDLFSLMVTLVRTHGVAVPGDVAAVFRTLASLDRSLRALDPDTDLLSQTRSLMPELLRGMSAPERIAARAAGQAVVTAAAARRLPARIEHLSAALTEGRLTVHARSFADGSDRAWLRRQLDDAVAAGLAVAATIAAALLFTATGGPMLTSAIGLYQFLGAILAFGGVVLAFRSVVRLFVRTDRE